MRGLGPRTACRRRALDACEVRIIETLVQPDKGGLLTEPPKSRAGKRTLTFPVEIVPDLRKHLARYAEPGRRGLVFIGPKGGKIRRSNFNVIWSAACTAAGIPDAHFHDLRHTGGTLAATTGATPKELMTRLGHSSTRAAMIYQHATRDRDKAIAQALGTLADKAGTAHDLARGWPTGRSLSSGNIRNNTSACGSERRWSGRRESNPHDQLGRVVTDPGRPIQFATVTRRYGVSTLQRCLFG